MKIKLGLLAIALTGCAIPALILAGQSPAAAFAQREGRAWMNARLRPEQRVALLLPRMTRDEKLTLVFGYFGTDFPFTKYKAPAEGRAGSAGYVPGVPRLGIPAQWQTDAGIGVATQGGAVKKRERTALPSNLGIAATWNIDLAYKGGAMIGGEARASGFNVMLAGGVNLLREPRNGRNFEYGGEDPLLAGTMVGAQIAGIQSNHIISTVKHYAINDQETDRNAGNSVIDPKAARLSDLLAFEIALEKGRPGSVMCSYNRVNGPFACENPWLLRDVLRRDWGFKGYVMSDWGAVHSTAPSIAAGLDQESGFPFDKEPYLGDGLKKALADGTVTTAQLDTMVSRILYAMFRHGLFDHPVTAAPMDLSDAMLAADAAVSRAAAEQSIVLLKNDGGILPLAQTARRIVVIGGNADKGVIAGGGSSLVYPKGGNAMPDIAPKTWPGPVMFYPSSPLEALRRQLPNADISFVDGRDPVAAAALARNADVAIVFATQWAGESFDVSLSLKDDQDALIDAVAAANSKTVVVLETGGPVLTPWAGKTAGIVEAWYPGTAGGDAIASVLTGKVNPSGHLPVTFPNSVAELPHPEAPAKGDIQYNEGAAVGYKWYDRQNLKPAFAFGHGLSYTSFGYRNLTARIAKRQVTVGFTVQNLGAMRGMAVAQLYAAADGWEAPRRLAAFRKVELAPGQSRAVTLTLDPRLLADFDERVNCWRLRSGNFHLAIGDSSAVPSARARLTLAPRALVVPRGFCRRG
jgi:beta-glucosidase